MCKLTDVQVEGREGVGLGLEEVLLGSNPLPL